ncbi:MAG: hypothetical protein EOP45_08465, partial [Sphingobacteriaceae bacterium]
ESPLIERTYPFVNYTELGGLFGRVAYPSAFLLPRLEKRFYALVYLSLLLAFANFLVTSTLLILFQKPLLHWLKVEALGKWVYIVPASAFIYNLTLIMNAWYLRAKEFRKQAGINIVTSLGSRVLTLGAGALLNGSPSGLLLGETFNKVAGAGIIFLSGINLRVHALVQAFSWTRIRAVAYEYREYPLYVSTAGYLETLAFQLPPLLLTSSFGATAVGLYAFSTSLLELPINVVGKAIGPVFLQKATETYEHEPARLSSLCLELYNKLLYIGLLPFGIITVYGDWIFRFVFGARWEAAGVFTAYLGYYYVFRLASFATSPIYAVLRRQRLALWGIMLLVAVRAVSLGIGIYMNSLNFGMMLFGIGSLLVTFGIDMNILYLLKVKIWRVVLKSTIAVLGTLSSLYIIRLSIQYLAGW